MYVCVFVRKTTQKVLEMSSTEKLGTLCPLEVVNFWAHLPQGRGTPQQAKFLIEHSTMSDLKAP